MKCIYCGSTEDLRDFPACASAGKSDEMICEECDHEISLSDDSIYSNEGE